MNKRRLGHLPRLPHKPKPKKSNGAKRPVSSHNRIERELLDALDPVHDGLRCSFSRGMISTKLQGR